jgi:RNA polymerase sigma factor (sigma-70 family)
LDFVVAVTLRAEKRSKKVQDLAQESMPTVDEEIIRRVLAGEKRAFGELVDRHKHKAMTLALRMLKNREEAEEALQDAFVRAFRALPQFEWKASFSTWFYRIVYNVCASALGKRSDAVHLSFHDDDEQNLDVPSEEPLPDVAIESREIQIAVNEEIEKLPVTYVGILTLFFVNDLSYDQIVEATGLSLSAVKVRLFRGRMLLRDAVAKRLGVTKATVL